MLRYTKHKRMLSFATLLMIMAIGTCAAQDCESLVRPKFDGTPGVYDQLPQQKIQHYCNFAHNAFYWSDTLPQNAVTYNISDVRSKSSGQHLPQNTSIDLRSFSYYAYDFEDFQHRHYHDHIYFKVGSGTGIRYLALRDINTIYQICGQLENN